MVMDLKSFTALLSACVHPLQKGRHRTSAATATLCNNHAARLFDSLVASGQPPSMEIFNLVSKTLAMASDAKGAARVAKHLDVHGLKPSTLFRANIVQAHGRRNVSVALGLYEAMKKDGVRVRTCPRGLPF